MHERKAAELFSEELHSRALAKLKDLLKQADVRFYLSYLLRVCKPLESPFDEKINVSFKNLGRQEVGLALFNDIMFSSPEMYLLMKTEEEALTEEAKKFIKDLTEPK
jgi:hypothetical protein